MSDVLTREDVIRETDYMQSFDADHLGLLGASNLLRNHDAADAARSAERQWQAKRMLAYINGEVQP